MVDDVVGFDAERILEDPGGAVAVVTGDRFGEMVGRGYASLS
jgi:hypothetical protein